MKILLLLTGFLMLAVAYGLFIVPLVFAQVQTDTIGEYTDYTNIDVLKVKLKYPSDWKLEENVSRLDADPAIILSEGSGKEGALFTITRDENFTMDLMTYTKMLNKQTKPFLKTRVVEDTHITQIGNNYNAATFLLATELPNNTASHQVWNVKIGNTLYTIQYIADIEYFNSPERTQIRNDIINSIEFLP